jgi:hypothetical protein
MEHILRHRFYRAIKCSPGQLETEGRHPGEGGRKTAPSKQGLSGRESSWLYVFKGWRFEPIRRVVIEKMTRETVGNFSGSME